MRVSPESFEYTNVLGDVVRALVWKRSTDVSDLGTHSMVYIHGAFAHAGDAQTLAEYFVPRGYSIYAFDLHRHGLKGEAKPLTLKSWRNYVDDVLQFYHWVAEQEDESPLLVGHSMGGLIAFASTLELGSEKLPATVVSSPWLATAKPIPTFLKFALSMIGGIYPGFAADAGIVLEELTHDQAIIQRHYNDVAAKLRGTKGTAGWLKQVEALQRHVLSNLSAIHTPLLYLQAGDDKLVSVETARKAFHEIGSEHKVYHEYDGFYHEIFNELERHRPLEDMDRFLMELWKND